jgi:hypothetical protein
MSMIPLINARYAVASHLRSILEEHFPATLHSVMDTRNLECYSPAPTGYFSMVRDPKAVLSEHPVSGFVYPSSDRITRAQHSGGGGTRAIWFDQRFRLDVLFMASVDDMASDKTLEEAMELRADIYADALLDIVYRYGLSPTAIHELELVRDDVNIWDMRGDEYTFGSVGTEWRVGQKVTVPFPQK